MHHVGIYHSVASLGLLSSFGHVRILGIENPQANGRELGIHGMTLPCGTNARIRAKSWEITSASTKFIS
jgi:hypothetical protein